MWSFTLRDGGTFEDGSEITCADVAYGVSRTWASDVITDGPTYASTYIDAGDYPGPYKATAEQQAAVESLVDKMRKDLFDISCKNTREVSAAKELVEEAYGW